MQAFDVYTSAWFSSDLPAAVHLAHRLRHPAHEAPLRRAALEARRARRCASAASPATPSATASGRSTTPPRPPAPELRSAGYRVARLRDSAGEKSVSAERGYLRETGNLVFHTALVGILVDRRHRRRLRLRGPARARRGRRPSSTPSAAFDSFNPGRFFDPRHPRPVLADARPTCDVTYEQQNQKAFGQPIDYTATVTITEQDGGSTEQTIKVNEPLNIGGTNVYLLGNGYAPTITVRDPDGHRRLHGFDPVPPAGREAHLDRRRQGARRPRRAARHDRLLLPDARARERPPYFSSYPDLEYPVLTLNVFEGDLGIDAGTSDIGLHARHRLDDRAHRRQDRAKSLELKPGRPGAAERPRHGHLRGRGDPSGDAAPPSPTRATPRDRRHRLLQVGARFASFDIHHDPTQGWVLVFAILVLAGLLTSPVHPAPPGVGEGARRRRTARCASSTPGSPAARTRGSMPRSRRGRQARATLGCRSRRRTAEPVHPESPGVGHENAVRIDTVKRTVEP